MSSFNGRLVELVFKAIILVVLSVGSLEMLALYMLNRIFIFYVLFCPLLIITVVYGIKLYFAYANFTETINQGLYDPVGPKVDKRLSVPLPEEDCLKIETDDLALKICVDYANGLSTVRIRDKFGLNHRQDVCRLLRKGLRKLLKERNERA